MVGDLVQITNPIIKQSCCIQSTTVAKLNLWVEISKSQIGEFVLLIQIIEWRSQSHSRRSHGFGATCSHTSKYYMR